MPDSPLSSHKQCKTCIFLFLPFVQLHICIHWVTFQDVFIHFAKVFEPGKYTFKIRAIWWKIWSRILCTTATKRIPCNSKWQCKNKIWIITSKSCCIAQIWNVLFVCFFNLECNCYNWFFDFGPTRHTVVRILWQTICGSPLISFYSVQEQLDRGQQKQLFNTLTDIWTSTWYTKKRHAFQTSQVAVVISSAQCAQPSSWRFIIFFYSARKSSHGQTHLLTSHNVDFCFCNYSVTLGRSLMGHGQVQ